jgi:hypothetical protein
MKEILIKPLDCYKILYYDFDGEIYDSINNELGYDYFIFCLD